MLQDPLLKYYFDSGVFAFGQTVEFEVETAGRKAENSARGGRPNPKMVKLARQQTLAKWLGIKMKTAKPDDKKIKAEFSA